MNLFLSKMTESKNYKVYKSRKNLDPRFHLVKLFIEAGSLDNCNCMLYKLEHQHSDKFIIKTYFEQSCPSYTIGHTGYTGCENCHTMQTHVTFWFVKINETYVCFYEPSSQVVDWKFFESTKIKNFWKFFESTEIKNFWKIVEEWIKTNFPGIPLTRDSYEMLQFCPKK